MDHSLDGKGLLYQMEEVIIIIFLILTTKRKLQHIEFLTCMEPRKQRQKRQSRDLNLKDTSS